MGRKFENREKTVENSGRKIREKGRKNFGTVKCQLRTGEETFNRGRRIEYREKIRIGEEKLRKEEEKYKNRERTIEHRVRKIKMGIKIEKRVIKIEKRGIKILEEGNENLRIGKKIKMRRKIR